MDEQSYRMIGSACDYGPCSAPVRVIVDFAFGHLHLCRHHWMAAQEMITATPTFLRASGVNEAESVALL